MISEIRGTAGYTSVNRIKKTGVVNASPNASGNFANIMEDKANQKKSSDTKEETIDGLLEEIQQKNQEMYEKLKNGDTEEKVQIGGSELTATEWKKLLTRIDKEIDVIKKDIKKEEETAKEKALKKANKEVVLAK